MSFELTSPAILLCLGMIVVVAALLVVYFESRLREQNHRLKTMLSLITTLAEDTNSLKHRQVKSFYTDETSLEDERIEVSDGEDPDDEEDDSEIVDLDDLEDESDSETESKVDMESESEEEEDEEEEEDDSEIECEEVVNSDEEVEENIKVLKLNAPIEGVLSDNVEDQMISSELTDELDYKQMPVAKLRQIATEKGIENAIKLKKNDLLKILL